MTTDPESCVLYFLEKPLLCVLDDRGQPWLKAKEIAEILDYQKTNQAIESVVQSEDQVFFDTFPTALKQSLPHVQKQTLFINEAGIYSLALKSQHPQAGELKRWITSTLQPSVKNCRERALTAEMHQVKSDRVIKPEDVGELSVFVLVRKNVVHRCEDGQFCRHPRHYEYCVMRVQEVRLNHSLKQLQKKFPELHVILEIRNNPYSLNLNGRVRAWGKRTGLIKYHRNDLRATLSESALIDKIMEIHDERFQ